MTVDQAAPAAAELGSLSPSRAGDFRACALRYRLRCIDRLPETPSLPAARGTLVHAVLDELFGLPPASRTPDAATALLSAAWERLAADAPEVAELLHDPAERDVWLASAAELLRRYFTLEDPSGLEPRARELRVETVVGDVRLRGVVDRLDVGDDGRLLVTDYKSGHSPGAAGETAALFQLKFYALVIWRSQGVVPRLRLLYLRDGASLDYDPDADELARFEPVVLAVWQAIRTALPDGDFRPNPGPVCAWCDFHDHCPAFGATPPPYPERPVLTDPRDTDPACESPQRGVTPAPAPRVPRAAAPPG